MNESNGGVLAAMGNARFSDEDATRSEWLNRQIALDREANGYDETRGEWRPGPKPTGVPCPKGCGRFLFSTNTRGICAPCAKEHNIRSKASRPRAGGRSMSEGRKCACGMPIANLNRSGQCKPCWQAEYERAKRTASR